jgi:hypothetical protein
LTVIHHGDTESTEREIHKIEKLRVLCEPPRSLWFGVEEGIRMDGLRFTVPVHLGGTLAADQSGRICLPCGATLVEVSAGASNDSDAKLKVGVGGTSADDDGIHTLAVIGDSGAAVVWDRGDFDGALVSPQGAFGSGQLWHGARGALVTWGLDFDGASGTAAQNVDILFTFVEG